MKVGVVMPIGPQDGTGLLSACARRRICASRMSRRPWNPPRRQQYSTSGAPWGCSGGR